MRVGVGKRGGQTTTNRKKKSTGKMGKMILVETT